MPSAWDLKQEDLKPFGEIEEVVRSRKNYCSQYDRLALLKLYHVHGHERTLFVIERSMGNDWLKPDRWPELMELVVKYDVERVRVAIQQMNKLENHSIATVEGLLNGSIAPVRKPAGAKPERGRPIAEKPWPPKDHVYDRYQAQRWMTEHDKPMSAGMEYFELVGRDIYKLKAACR